MIHRPLFLLLAALAAFAPLAIDLYLPSLGQIALDLNTTGGRAEQTVTVFLAGFALGMLFYGPLSDRYGRRKMIFAGTSLFVLASVACMFAQSIEQLLAFRLLQAFGGGAAAVVARAVVRDLFSETDAARVMAMIGMVTSLAPMLAPMAGAWVLLVGSWRHEFFVLAVFGGLCMWGAHRLLPETLSTSRSQSSLRMAFKGYGQVIRQPGSLWLIGTGGCHFAAMFAYITGTPLVYMGQFGVSEQTYALLFGANIVSLMLFGWYSARHVKKTGTHVLIVRGNMASLAGALLVGVAAWLLPVGPSALGTMVAGFLLCVGSLGCVAPNTMAQLLEKHPNNAGAASALYGFAQFGLGGLASFGVSLVHNGTAQPMASLVMLFVVLAFACRVGLTQTSER
ncbi:MAG TPA: multidrug effflux MFS transporter [Limnobacter sp.]|nr:multidrug effflux MFS transporter [Limnobacter sp.]